MLIIERSWMIPESSFFSILRVLSVVANWICFIFYIYSLIILYPICMRLIKLFYYLIYIYLYSSLYLSLYLFSYLCVLCELVIYIYILLNLLIISICVDVLKLEWVAFRRRLYIGGTLRTWNNIYICTWSPSSLSLSHSMFWIYLFWTL